MRAHVIYARKSTESEDRQVLSIDSQIRELREMAQRRGIVATEVLTETKSAKAPGRPVFGQLMRRVHKGQIGAVICWKMDRLARNHLDTGSILQALADGQLQEVITSDRTYTRDGNDRFMGNFELGIATKFIDDLRANVKRGNRERFRRGWINYLPPLGYINDRATKTIVADPERFNPVRRMFELVLTGSMRPRDVLRVANEEWGFRTRRFKRSGDKPLSRSVFFRMLGDRFYMGVIQLRSGETFPGAHPPMITRGEFERIQEIMGRPGRARSKHHSFAFTGIITCGGCGGKITAEEHIKKGRRYAYYRCSRHKGRTKCTEPPIAERDLEAQLHRAFGRLTMPERARSWMIRQVEKVVRREDASREAVHATVTKARDTVAREMENLLSLRLRDLVVDDVFVQKKCEIEERIATLDAKLREPSRTSEEVKSLTLATIDFGRRVSEMFVDGTAVQKRMILESVGLNYTLRARMVTFSYRNPFQILSEAAARSNWCTTADDVRNWLQDTTEYFALPNLGSVSPGLTQSTA